LLLAGTALLLHTRSSTDRNPFSEPLAQLPGNIEGWVGSDQQIDQETLDILGAGDFLSRIYSRNAQTAPIASSSVIFPLRELARPSIPEALPARAGWVFESSDYVNLVDVNGKPHRVGEYIITTARRGSLSFTGTRRTTQRCK